MIRNFIENNNLEYYENKSLKRYNSYKLDVVAKYIVFPKNEEELKSLLINLVVSNIKYIVLGNGSNVIFACDYYDGVVIRLDKFNSLKVDGNHILVGAGYSLTKLAMVACEKGLSGLEFASGIPGFVGASVAMNAGAYTHSLSEVIVSVRVMTDDGKIKNMNANELEFGYRTSFFKKHKNYIILSCKFNLFYGDKNEIIELMEKRKIRRLESQPLEYPSAGSVFRNPDGNFAGKLIEDVGLKGYKLGGAMVSLKHANFIINYNKATGKDIVNLINLIKEKVRNKYNVDLILEQIIVD